MSTSTLRVWLAGPLQSWGTASRFEVRATDMVPSKSGVIGLVCAALGRPRSETVDDLAALRFGVRVEQQGSVLRDFHTVGAGVGAGGVAVSSGARSQARGIVTERYYLQDAAFVAGLEGQDPDLLIEIHRALLGPCRPLALGRRACPPAGPVVDADALYAGPLEDALTEEWWPGRAAGQASQPAGPPSTSRMRRPWSPAVGAEVEVCVEDPEGPVAVQDQPIGAAFADRTFATRRVRSIWIAREEGD